MAWKENYKYWIENMPKELVPQVESFSDKEKEEYFGNEISFGTAGLRGIMGYAPKLMNEFNIAKYSLAMGKMLLNKYGDIAREHGVVIAHDNRRNNILFSETAGKVFSGLKIPVFFFEDNKLQPTPLLSYTIAKGSYIGGINITASHNPPNYSGFKVYDHTGTQMLPEQTDLILSYSKEDVNIFNIEMNEEYINYLSSSIEAQYEQSILEQIPFKPLTEKKDIKVIYTAQHGTAGKLAERILKKMGVDFEMVKEQLEPDPEFSNTESPNPQDPKSFILAREYGDKYNSDVLFCTDPDADRFGIEVKHNGKWVHINGNQLPLIQLEYKLRKLDELGYLNKGDFIVRSVVTSRAADRIAELYDVTVYENLTGFKWLISESRKHEQMGNESLFIWEESYGSTVKTLTRDKDSFQALVQVIEIIDEYKKKGMTLVDALDEIYKKIGYFETSQIQKRFEGSDGMKKMNALLDKARKINDGDMIGEYRILNVIDFAKGYKDFFKDNFVMFELENDMVVTLRPSGTEPMLRMYFDVPGQNKEKTKKTIRELEKLFQENI